jgi:ascorbate-specific PTS system EIIC-type component UlaA
MCTGGAAQTNSWRLRFQGQIVADGAGTRLTGTLGPNGFIPVFSAIWLGFVSLFFLGGLIGLFSDLAGGHNAISLLPFVLVPAAMIAGFFAITEIGTRLARAEWAMMDHWLRQLLEVSG